MWIGEHVVTTLTKNSRAPFDEDVFVRGSIFVCSSAHGGIIVRTIISLTDFATTSDVTVSLYAGSDSAVNQNVAQYSASLNISGISAALIGLPTFTPALGLWSTAVGTDPFTPSPAGYNPGTFAGNPGTPGLNVALTPYAQDAAHLLGQLSFTVNRPVGPTDLTTTLLPSGDFGYSFAASINSVAATFEGADLTILAQPAPPGPTSVPEPASAGIMAAAGLGLAWFRRRRSTAAAE